MNTNNAARLVAALALIALLGVIGLAAFSLAIPEILETTLTGASASLFTLLVASRGSGDDDAYDADHRAAE